VIDDQLTRSLQGAEADWWPEPPTVLPTQRRPEPPRASRTTVLTTLLVVLVIAGSGAALVSTRSARQRSAVLDRPTGARPCGVGDARLEITPHVQATDPQLSYDVMLVALNREPCRVWTEDEQVTVTEPDGHTSGFGTCSAHNLRRVGPGGVTPPVLVPRHPCLPGDREVPVSSAPVSATPTDPDYGRVLCTCGTYTDPAPHSEVVLADRAAKQGGPWPVFRSIGSSGGLAVPGGDPLGTYRITATDGPWTAQPVGVVVMTPTGKLSRSTSEAGGALTLEVSPTSGPAVSRVAVNGTVSDPGSCPVARIALTADAATGAASLVDYTPVRTDGTFTDTYSVPDTSSSERGTEEVIRMMCVGRDHSALNPSATAVAGFELVWAKR
jgi:hypothetical protein